MMQGLNLNIYLLSNLSQSFIANLEKGKKQPSVFTLLRIADALNVNPQDFSGIVF